MPMLYICQLFPSLFLTAREEENLRNWSTLAFSFWKYNNKPAPTPKNTAAALYVKGYGDH